jgi:hypothetical protein
VDEEVHPRVAVLEPAQHVGHQAGAEAGRRAQAHAPPSQLGDLLHLAACGLGVGEDAAGQGQQGGARVGQRDVAARPVEQLGSQLAFERADLLGQRRLCHVLALRRPREVPHLGDGGEVAELLELHGTEPTRRDPTSIGDAYGNQRSYVLD